MSGRAIVIALSASIATVVAGAIVAAATVVVVGMLSALASGMLLVIKTDDTTQPMGELLFADDPQS